MLKGIAIPSNNLGAIIPDFFLANTSDIVIANAYYTNMRQIEDYFDESVKHHSNPTKNTYEHVKDTSQEIQDAYKKLFTEGKYSANEE